MDIKAMLDQEHSKTQIHRIVQYIGNSTEKFDLLMSILLEGDYRTAQRASWVLSESVQRYPQLVIPYLEDLLLYLKQDIHNAVKRNTLKLFQFIKIPQTLWGETADICFQLLGSAQEPVAIKVFAMSVLANLCNDVPEFQGELKIIIEDQLPYASPGFKARAKKVFSQLASYALK